MPSSSIFPLVFAIQCAHTIVITDKAMHIVAGSRDISKVYGSQVKYSYCRPVNYHWDACALETNPLKQD